VVTGAVKLQEVIKYFFPTRFEIHLGTITGMVGAMGTYLFGAWDSVIECLVFAMVVDYITGLAAAYINPGLMLDSHKGFKGILKKVFILTIVAFTHKLDLALNTQAVCTMTTWFFIGIEGLSIIENSAKAGIPIPQKLIDTLEQLKGANKK
jgi:toxin secretion/phage lysis holin